MVTEFLFGYDWLYNQSSIN